MGDCGCFKGRILGDGSIAYVPRGREFPPLIEGYERDPKDPWKLRPIWTECQYRTKALQLKPCGAFGAKFYCENPGLPTFQKALTLADCQGCPLANSSNKASNLG